MSSIKSCLQRRRHSSRSIEQRGLARVCVVLELLFLTGLHVQAAEPSLEPTARFRAESGREYFLLTCRGIADPADVLRVRVRDAALGTFVTQRTGPDTGRAVLATEHGAPGEVVLSIGDDSRRVALDWSQVRSDPGLRRVWRQVVEIEHQELVSAGESVAWSRFVLDRLRADAGESASGGFLEAQNRWRGRPTAFDLTTGAVAIEESLQLDRLRGTGRDRKQPSTVPLESIPGVEIRAHPWKKMLAGRDPASHPIERFLPLDQYAFEASSFRSLIELADWMDEHGSPLVELLEDRAEDSGVKARLERQLCLPASALARKLGPVVIGRVAATGSDPFLREGADLTLIFEMKAAPVFFANLEKNRALAESSHAGCQRIEETYGEYEIRGLVSPHRTISSYSAEVDGHALVSNSLVGLKASIDAHSGKRPTQADGLDRKFVRTLLPSGKGEEAFVFLSDPAIRRLVSPGLKLRESRRLECSTSLRAISYATAWRQLRGATPARELGALVASQDLPAAQLFCPDGGKYRLLDDHRRGACSVHGHLEFLTPNCEVDLTLVTEEEKIAYERFRVTYQRYWSRFFDPIGMQIDLDAERDGRKVRRIETVILPLLDMSEYRQLRDFTGGEGAQLAKRLPEAGGDTTALLSAHINQKGEAFRWVDEFVREQSKGVGLGWIGDRISIFLRDAPPDFEPPKTLDRLDDVFERLWDGYPGGIRIAVRDKLRLAAFLAAFRAYLQSTLPDTLQFRTLDAVHGVQVVRVGPEETPPNHYGPEAVYYAAIGDGLWLALDLESIHELARRQKESAEARSGTGGEASTLAEEKSWIDGSHLSLGIDLQGSPRWRAILTRLERGRGELKCRGSRRRLQNLLELGLVTPAGWRSFSGAAPRCPLGGELRDEEGMVRCTHGESSGGERQAIGSSSALDALRAALRFTEDGVHTTLEIEP